MTYLALEAMRQALSLRDNDEFIVQSFVKLLCNSVACITRKGARLQDVVRILTMLAILAIVCIFIRSAAGQLQAR